jgi:hypothetical protein
VAVAAKRRVVINAGKRRRKRNRRMTAKQIKFFGSKAQKAALKRSNKSHRRRTAAHSRPNRRKARSNRSHRPRKNPGDILSLVLNTGKGKKMAAPKKRRRSRRRSTSNPRRYHRRRATNRMNPARRHHSYGHRRRTNRRRHNRRRNPGAAGMSVKQGMMFAVGAGVGFFGSKLLTQAVMGASNTGTTGYLGNAVATAGLAVTAHMFRGVLGKSAGIAVLSGGILQLLARILTDNTPFGQFTSALGVGDYQMQNFVTPQRLIDPLNSAAIEIPSGWGAPAVAVSSNGAPAHMLPKGTSGYNTQGFGTSLYSPQGLYS